MQVVDTLVTRAGSDVTVEFLGQGNEVIHVTFAGNSEEDAAAILKARAMMAQVATFDVPPKIEETEFAYDTGRQELLDEVTCVLEYMEAGTVRRTEEVTFPTMEAAHLEVERSAIDLVESLATQGVPNGWAVRAVDAEGNLIASMTFAEAKEFATATKCRSAPPPSAVGHS